MRKHRKVIRPEPEEDATEPTVMPLAQPDRKEEDVDRVVPATNVGGAAPTVLGGDSGGERSGAAGDLASLIEPEPPESPEVGAVHVRRERARWTRRAKR
jgi:hypothetical protein